MEELYNRSSSKQQGYISKRLNDWMIGLKLEPVPGLDRVSNPGEFVADAVRKLDRQFRKDDRD